MSTTAKTGTNKKWSLCSDIHFWLYEIWNHDLDHTYHLRHHSKDVRQ